MPIHTSSNTSYALRERSVSGDRVLSPQVGERVPQLVAGAMDVRLHGAKGEIERRGDLLVRAPLHMAQHDTGAVLRAQRRDRPLDRRAELARFDLLQRRLSP